MSNYHRGIGAKDITPAPPAAPVLSITPNFATLNWTYAGASPVFWRIELQTQAGGAWYQWNQLSGTLRTYTGGHLPPFMRIKGQSTSSNQTTPYSNVVRGY